MEFMGRTLILGDSGIGIHLGSWKNRTRKPEILSSETRVKSNIKAMRNLDVFI